MLPLYQYIGLKATQDKSLTPWEVIILKSVKSRRLPENAIARATRLNEAIVSELITDLMYKGLIERRRYKRMLFLSREYFTITLEGLAALQARENSIDKAIELLKVNSLKVAEEIIMLLPPIARDTVKATYNVAKFILK